MPPPDPSLITSTVSYNHRKMLIASFGVDEWTVDWSDADGAMVYESAVNSERTIEMPSSLDRLGQLRSLIDLRCDNNQLRDLPPSLANLKNLQAVQMSRELYQKIDAGHGQTTIPKNA